ncbi:MAG: hypothetical protein QW041_00150 [Candidatus Pacearchaeota archaeon]
MEEKEEKELELEKEKLLSMSEIALWLDSYDDIFSDFDPRPYTQRALSIDFLDEIKRASRDKASGQIELRFLVPKDLRKESEENQIKRRLREHFKKHYEQSKKEMKKTFYNGFLIAGGGFLFMFIGVLFHYFLGEKILTDILITLFEPLGWFMMFYGFDTAFYGFKQKKLELDFYEKMLKSEIYFISY